MLTCSALKNDNDFIIVNYNRSAIGQTGGGHISPIAAYHEKTDKFMIQDVSSYKYPPVWVSATMLWNAMNTGDAISGKTRGYLIVKT
ncbi:phytochelatin synthase [Kalymmatonema gypsitolerans NIES-4073]|nr:phytochelatin synthase [Scytonema sp. NIES-4073]